jgi:hypothetical protein
MKTHMRYLAAVVLTSSALLATEVERKEWHRPEREYAEYDSVALRVVDYAAVRKIRVGMTFAAVKKLVGVAPTDYHIHPAYAILATTIDGQPCEVALLHRGGQTVQALSFRVWEKKEPNKAPEPTR